MSKYFALIILILELNNIKLSVEGMRMSDGFLNCFVNCIHGKQNGVVDVNAASSNVTCGCKPIGKLFTTYWNFHFVRPAATPSDFKQYVVTDVNSANPRVPCHILKDCATLKNNNRRRKDGIYTIDPGDGRGSFKAYCDMTTQRGGWTVIQSRKDGSGNFNRTFDEYANGFGSLKNNFWLGNEKVRRLVRKSTTLRFDLTNSDGDRRHASFKKFYIHGRSQLYEIEFDGYSGNAGNSIYQHHKFSAFDMGPRKDCASKLGGGWWYVGCPTSFANLNGKYLTEHKKHALIWKRWEGREKHLSSTEMKIQDFDYQTDCATLKARYPRLKSGMFNIRTRSGEKRSVYCDMETDGGGWTVIQRRTDGSRNFRWPFKIYEKGFGNKGHEFWLGARDIHNLVNRVPSVLRFDLKDIRNRSSYAEYDRISIGSRRELYELHMGDYRGTAGDGFRHFEGKVLTTYDSHSMYHTRDREGGWWYAKNLGSINDKYVSKDGSGIKWEPVDEPAFSLTFTEMKVRRTKNGPDCSHLKQEGAKSGMHSVNPDWKGEFDIYCDMEADDSGWMVIQRRLDGSEEFARGWKEYKTGFGNKSGEFWLGNDLLHRLTNSDEYFLRFDMEDFDGEKRYGIYKGFKVDSEKNNFKLSVASFCGDAGDSLSELNSHFFSTVDRKNYESLGPDCPEDVSVTGGWWYGTCHSSNPNGEYNTSFSGRSVTWRTFHDLDNALKLIEMKMRPFSR